MAGAAGTAGVAAACENGPAGPGENPIIVCFAENAGAAGTGGEGCAAGE